MLDGEEVCHLTHTLRSQIQALIHEKYWGFIKVVSIAFDDDDPFMTKFIIMGVSTLWFEL